MRRDATAGSVEVEMQGRAEQQPHTEEKWLGKEVEAVFWREPRQLASIRKKALPCLCSGQCHAGHKAEPPIFVGG